jgi:hypothetical protein
MYLMTSRLPIPDPSDFPAGPPLVLDLGCVESLSAAGIGELVGLQFRLHASGGRLVLINVGDHAFRAIEQSRLTEALGVRRQGVVRPAPDEAEVMESGEEVGKVCGKA